MYNHIFPLTSASVKDFIDKYTQEIIVKLLPGLQVPGYTEP